jgi:hypothetical protein
MGTRLLNYDGDAVARRITLTLPSSLATSQGTSVWSLVRSMAEVFKMATDAIDELFINTNLRSATGEFLNDYVYDLTKLKRKAGETDAQLRTRFGRSVFDYNATENGMENIVFDIMAETPVLKTGMDRGAFYDSLYYYNDAQGISIYGTETGTAYVGYIILDSVPTAAQIEELCETIQRHKSLGIKIYIKYRRLKDYTGSTYEEIVTDYTGKEWCKIIGPAAYGEFFDARSFYSDTNYPSIYGQEDESGLDHLYIFLPSKPVQTTIDDMLESLSDNLVPGDSVYLVYPE